MTPFSPQILRTPPPPVMEARRWIAAAQFPPDRPLLNVSQAAPVEPPPEALRAAMAEMVLEEADTHLYGPVLGMPALRAEIAARWSIAYGGEIVPADVAVTSGANQAFCAAIATLAAPGEAVMLPVPWYFNHKMWLDIAGVEAVPLPCGPDMLPDPQAARARMTGRVKAIVLVTPNNPTGAEYPPALVAEFAGIAREAGAALIVDETYRDFHSGQGAPHALFADPAWRDVLIHIYSFSKAFRLTGHRVGALVADPARLSQVEKFIDTMTICAPQLGQKAALWGLRNLGNWVAEQRDEILARRDAARRAITALPGWELLGCGAYFAYARHPFPIASSMLAPRLVREASVLLLPGTMFAPGREEGGDGAAEHQLRIAFANADVPGIAQLGARLGAFTPG